MIAPFLIMKTDTTANETMHERNNDATPHHEQTNNTSSLHHLMPNSTVINTLAHMDATEIMTATKIAMIVTVVIIRI